MKTIDLITLQKLRNRQDAALARGQFLSPLDKDQLEQLERLYYADTKKYKSYMQNAWVWGSR